MIEHVNSSSGVGRDLVFSDRAVLLPADGDIIDAAEVFSLLADPGRLRLLAVLRTGEASVGQLATMAGMSESATSHALRLLRAHRIVQVRRTGRMAYYRMADEHVRVLLDTALEHAGHSGLLHPERTGGGTR
ncbi:MAG TPA: metalloregulator ArsR/SmtB family transcription factor [Jatrophihabitantaceae bacterium]|nr:metalloregulator ArsR/SmtB family transcription factor [Jatrophihabitantaceae bacterium]